MIKFELAKQLKDAGFPQEYRKTPIAMDWVYDSTGDLIMIHDDNDTGWWLGQDYVVRFNKELLQKEYIKDPTLSELIEACGDKFNRLEKGIGGWIVIGADGDKRTDGSTPEIAVLKLWLALNKK